MLYLVSVEPYFSQGVGDYTYLCDSTDKVEAFRKLLREFAEELRDLAGIDLDDHSTEWKFFERVYVVEEEHTSKKKRSGSHGESAGDSADAGDERLCKCSLYFSAKYEDFDWLRDSPQLPVCYDESCSDGELMELPQLDHVNDNVFGDKDLSLEAFEKKFMKCANVEAKNFTAC